MLLSKLVSCVPFQVTPSIPLCISKCVMTTITYYTCPISLQGDGRCNLESTHDMNVTRALNYDHQCTGFSLCKWNLNLICMLSWVCSVYRWWTPRAKHTNCMGKKPGRDNCLARGKNEPSHTCRKVVYYASKLGHPVQCIIALNTSKNACNCNLDYPNYFLLFIQQSDLALQNFCRFRCDARLTCTKSQVTCWCTNDTGPWD